MSAGIALPNWVPACGGTETPFTTVDWRSAYEPGLSWAFRRPCGTWFRVCPNVASPRQRLLTMASCVAQRS